LKLKQTRRNLLASLASILGFSVFSQTASAAVLTPKSSEGPFYPRPNMRVADTDNDLVKIIGQIEEANGEIFTLRGTIKSKDGTPRAGLRIEIWQCDVNGKYLHPGDDQAIRHDEAFQGFGHDVTDTNGHYVFRTIKPTTYPGRAPHIHVKVLDGELELLTTQFYIKDHSDNAGDFLFRRMSENEAESISMTFTDGETGIEATIDVVV